MSGKTFRGAEYCMFRSPKILSRLVAAAVMALAASQGIAAGAAEQIGPAEVREIRAVIEGQLKAFAANDAALAFSYASASVRMQFGDAQSFMTMVRQGYPMLIQPSETLFASPDTVADGVIQTVHLRDRDGRAWQASYHMLRQPDGSWRINGCVVDPDRDDTST